MAKNPFKFPVEPISDNIIIERLTVKSKTEQKAEKAKIEVVDATGTPKNIMEIEARKAKELATYEGVAEELTKEWDEHPNQGIVMSVGPGRSLEEGVKIPIELKKGDHIYYRGRAGEPIIINKKLYWVIKEHEVFGKYITDK